MIFPALEGSSLSPETREQAVGCAFIEHLASHTGFAKFRVLVTNANGTTTVRTMAQLGITEINLTADTTDIRLPDGSAITGQMWFRWANGTKGTAISH